MINRDYLDVITDYFEQENYLESIDYLENCITQGSNQPNHYYWLGLAYLLADNWERCLATWLSLIVETSLEDENERLVVDLIDFLEQQIRSYLTKGKLRQAKIIHEIIFELNTDYENAEILAQLTSALYKLATNYGLNQEYDKAIIVYLDLLDFNPDYSPAWHSLALCYYQQGNYAEAHTAMQEAIERDSSDNNYYGLGRILEKQQDYGGAISAYNQAIELNPDFLDVYITLGNLHYEQKNVDRALKCYEHLLKKSNEVGQPQIKQRVEEIYHTNQYPQAAQYLGYFYYSKDKYAQAIHYYEDYLCQESGDIETYLNLGQSYARTNQTAKAIHFIEQKLESYPDNLSLRTFHQSILPIVFEKNEDIEFYRQRYQSLLEKLLIDYLPNTLDKANEAFAGTQKNNLFYLAYQGKNDVVIQQKYTTYLSSILKIAYPQFCQPKIFSDDIHRRKLRVGLVSQHLEGLGNFMLIGLSILIVKNLIFIPMICHGLTQISRRRPVINFNSIAIKCGT
ncbi:tetratricopeptide repeat protein [Synechocystis salina LEGE 06099]|uniref:tetratricopeptide repeat protein n=1 Tax=Synechocystis salina TaxID=945780 RepID=UPI00187F6514|nr:tetratricopeptide repeat protein [Synechocystis salina]MBE9202515.1 tetratricopeptide repeat protein [Synechocystis salina LEGE 06099]